MKQKLNIDSKDGTEVHTSTTADVPTSSQTIAKPIVSGLLSSELLLSRIEMYRQRLDESKTVSEKEYRMMMSALFGVKLIIGDLLIDNNG